MYNEKRYKGSVMRAAPILKGITAGLFSALFITAAVSFLGGSASWGAQFVSLGKLLLPCGALLGLCLALMQTTPKAERSFDISSLVFERNAPTVSVRVLAVGLLGILSVKLLYGSGLLFATAFHHQGLAALAFLLFLTALLILALLVVPFVLRILEAQVKRSALLSRVLDRPVVAWCFATGIALGALLPPLLIGPSAEGAFGFVGLIRLQGAKEAASLVLLVTVTLFAFGRIQKKAKKGDFRPPI